MSHATPASPVATPTAHATPAAAHAGAHAGAHGPGAHGPGEHAHKHQHVGRPGPYHKFYEGQKVIGMIPWSRSNLLWLRLMKPVFFFCDKMSERSFFFREIRNVWPWFAGFFIILIPLARMDKQINQNSIPYNMLRSPGFRRMMSTARGGSPGIEIGQMKRYHVDSLK